MIPTLNRIIWNILLVAFLAAGFAACQKDPSDFKDLETWIVKNYFLPGKDRATVESSFKVCGTNNEGVIDNLTFIYKSKSKDLNKTVDDLVSARIEGNCSDCNDDPRYNDIIEVLEKWRLEIESQKMSPDKLAYEYAFFQHLLYLKHTEKIQDESIRVFYEMAKSDSIKDCLKKRMPEKAKSGQRPKKTQDGIKKPKQKGEEGGKKDNPSKEDLNTKWILAAFVLLSLLAGRYIIRRFKNIGALPSQKVFSNANPLGSHGDQHQTGIDTQKQHNVERKISINESHAPKANEKQQPPTQDPPLIEKKKEIIPEKPAIAVPPVTEHEKNIEKPLPPPVQENKTTEKPPNETTHGSTVQFARIPSGNLFFSFSPHPEYPDTPFIIDERTSTFDLVKDPQTLERLFSMIDQLKDACELMNINQPRLNTYDVRTKGKVVREGEYWRITKKLKLDW